MQYGDHLTQLEKNISLVQERAAQEHDDQNWGGDEDNYTIAEPDFRSVCFISIID